MNMSEMTFGDFVEFKRKEKKITLRGFADLLDIAPAYMSDIEKGRRNPPEKRLDDIARILELTPDEKNLLLDLAAKEKDNTVSSDLPEYIMEKDIVRVALRKARDKKVTDEQWEKVIRIFEGEDE